MYMEFIKRSAPSWASVAASTGISLARSQAPIWAGKCVRSGLAGGFSNVPVQWTNSAWEARKTGMRIVLGSFMAPRIYGIEQPVDKENQGKTEHEDAPSGGFVRSAGVERGNGG